MKECFRNACVIYNCVLVLVLDNTPAHSNIESKLLEDESKNKILRQGPYSPILNLIVSVWSPIKPCVKKNLRESIWTLTEENLNDITKAEHHKN